MFNGSLYKNNQLQLLEQQDVISAYVIMADNKNNILESHKKSCTTLMHDRSRKTKNIEII